MYTQIRARMNKGYTGVILIIEGNKVTIQELNFGLSNGPIINKLFSGKAVLKVS